MDKITKRKQINDNLYINAKINGEDTLIEYYTNDEQRHCDFGPAVLSNDKTNNHQYYEWWENGKLIAVYDSKTGIMKKVDQNDSTNLYEVQVPEKWKGYEQTLKLHDIEHCNKPMPVCENELPPALASAHAEVLHERNDNNVQVIEIKNEFHDQPKSTELHSQESVLINPNPINKINDTAVTKESSESNRKISFKERLNNIKNQRVDSEEMLLNSKLEKLTNFDVHKRLSENEEFAKKDLFVSKIFGSIASTVLVGAVGAVVVGASTLAMPAVGVAAAVGGVIIGVTGSAVLLTGGVELFESASVIFKSTKAHNLDLVENELKQLKNNVEAFKVNQKLTVSDYFEASVTSIVDKYAEIKEKTKNLFKPLSEEDVVNRIKKIQKLKELDNNMVNKFKPG